MSYLSLAEMMRDFLITELCFERGWSTSKGWLIDDVALHAQRQAILRLLQFSHGELPVFQELKQDFQRYLDARDHVRRVCMSRAKRDAAMRRLAHSRIHQIERLDHFVDRMSGDADNARALALTA